MNLDCPFLAAWVANVRYDLLPEHEARLSSATHKDTRQLLSGGGSNNAAAQPPHTLLGWPPSRAVALNVSKELTVSHQSNFSCPGLPPGLSPSQASRAQAAGVALCCFLITALCWGTPEPLGHYITRSKAVACGVRTTVPTKWPVSALLAGLCCKWCTHCPIPSQLYHMI